MKTKKLELWKVTYSDGKSELFSCKADDLILVAKKYKPGYDIKEMVFIGRYVHVVYPLPTGDSE